ncbi:hypothetical protein [Kitasatospora sp. NBC_01539]|uniref:hypothetical protein n=1 Tax=Kitasatospora sp. NBC_01539 TaxID=2903577 RepID=UPI0038603014
MTIGHRPGTTHRAPPAPDPSPYDRPLWLVTMPTTTHDGRRGTQSFVVRGTTLQDAVTAAERRARADSARLRRRDARIHPRHASAVLHH